MEDFKIGTPTYGSGRSSIFISDAPELMSVWNERSTVVGPKIKTEENVLSSGYMFKIYDIKRENYMLTQLKPLLFTIRLLFRFPYVIDENNRLALKWLNVWTLHTIVGYLAQSFFALELSYRLFGLVSVELDFILIVKIAVNILIVLTLLFTPLSAMTEWKAYCIYLNQWVELQVDFEEITGKPFTTNMGLLIKISIGVIFVQSYFAVYMGTNTLTQITWYHKYVYMVVIMTLSQQLLLWVICQYESSRMGSLLKEYINDVLSSDSPMNNPTNAYKLRLLWLRLVYVGKLLGNASFTIIVLISVGGIVFLSGAYVIMSSLIQGDSRAKEFLGLVLVGALAIIVISEFSHRTTEKVGTDICEALVNLKSPGMDQETTKEVERFLRIAAFNSPTVSLAGLANIDRSTLVSMGKNVITYLIVLIQFQLTTNEDITVSARNHTAPILNTLSSART